MRDTLYKHIERELTKDGLVDLKDANYNENLANIVLNRLTAGKIFDAGERLIQKADPIFMKPDSKYGRAHFFAPYKLVGNLRLDTLIFNILAIWLMITALFFALYYNLLKKFIFLLEKLNIPFIKKFGREFLPI
jgi:hypothetical protein